MTEPTVAKVIEAYLHCRRTKEDVARRHKEEMAPYNERMARAEAWLLAKMSAAEINNIAADAGTAYIKQRTNCSVEDWEAFFGYMKENNAWHLLNHSANKTAVGEFLADSQELPPGIKWRAENVVQVRTNSK